jgi:hypothetical protein
MIVFEWADGENCYGFGPVGYDSWLVLHEKLSQWTYIVHHQNELPLSTALKCWTGS